MDNVERRNYADSNGAWWRQQSACCRRPRPAKHPLRRQPRTRTHSRSRRGAPSARRRWFSDADEMRGVAEKGGLLDHRRARPHSPGEGSVSRRTPLAQSARHGRSENGLMSSLSLGAERVIRCLGVGVIADGRKRSLAEPASTGPLHGWKGRAQPHHPPNRAVASSRGRVAPNLALVEAGRLHAPGFALSLFKEQHGQAM